MKPLSDKNRVALYEYLYNGDVTPKFLYEDFMNDMPYGTAKARDGDPDNWLADRQDEIEDRYEEDIELEAFIRLERAKVST